MKRKQILLAIAFVLFWQAGMAQTTHLKGLTVILNYPDYPYGVSEDSVDKMMNQTNFHGWGMLGSVKDYFYTQTNGKCIITNEVISVAMSKNLSEYYIGSDIGTPTFILEVVALINQKYPAGFTGLSTDPRNENRLSGFNLLSPSLRGRSYAFNKESYDGAYVLNNGQPLLIGTGNISLKYAEEKPVITTICHEMGHSYFGWADYYTTAFSNLGDYDVMGGGGTEKAPMPVNPGLRLKEGWIDNIVYINGTNTEYHTLTANNYAQIHKYTNPTNEKEYLLFQALKHGGYYQPVVGGKTMDEGLAIWYVDEDAGYDQAGVWNAPLIHLIQADKKDEMHDEFTPDRDDLRGDQYDLYDNTTSTFPNGHPARWKDGGEFGIAISEISAPTGVMTFLVTGKPHRVLATSDRNGTISPKGVISVTGGTNKTFTFIPNLGYEVDVVKVDGAIVASASSYTMNSISGTNSISVTFKKKAAIDPLPSPWQQADIGPGTAGLSAFASGKFNLESFGTGISGGADNFRFVFQTLNGDGSIVAKIDQYNKAFWSSKAGLMIRESLQPSSSQTMIVKIPQNGVSSEERVATGMQLQGNSNSNLEGSLHIYNLYNWLKITRVGNEITTFCSKDQTNWVEISRKTLSLSNSVYIGMCVTGAYGNYACKAVFDSVTVTTANPSPVVSITSPANNTTFAVAASVTINAIAEDVNGSVTKVEFYNGPVLLGTDYTAPYSLTWTKVIGTSTIYAKATDNQGAVTTSIPVRIIAPCTFTESKINGTVIGTPGSWGGSGSTREKAFDGDINTYFDAPESIGWAGLSLANHHKITGINFYPRAEFAGRMVGGKFQASTSADFSTGVVELATISEEPTYGWNCLAVSVADSFQYVRYISPIDGIGNVAELEFYGKEIVTSDIIGAACGNNNSSITYEVSASKRVNASSFNWWYTGAAQNITAVTNTAYKATLQTGSNFGAGQVCVGINYTVAPWYTSYCKPVAKCAGSRLGMMDGTEVLLTSEIAPNPSFDVFNLTLAADAQVITIVNETGKAVYQKMDSMAGDIISLGENFGSGLYLVRIHYVDGTKEAMKILKVK